MTILESEAQLTASQRKYIAAKKTGKWAKEADELQSETERHGALCRNLLIPAEAPTNA